MWFGDVLLYGTIIAIVIILLVMLLTSSVGNDNIID